MDEIRTFLQDGVTKMLVKEPSVTIMALLKPWLPHLVEPKNNADVLWQVLSHLVKWIIGGSHDSSEEAEVSRQGNTQNDLDSGDNNVSLSYF